MARRRFGTLRTGGMLLALAWGTACASTVPPPAPDPPVARPVPGTAEAPTEADLRHWRRDLRARIVESAEAMIGTPYRYGGTTPAGFDCSGLVLYSYAEAGVDDLPRTASALEDEADAVRLSELRLGDLLFFRLKGDKTRHVGIYAGDRYFIHAPSPGKRVERVSFDHVYWGEKLDRAGRLLP